MSTHNICFYGEIRKIIPELSSNTPPYQCFTVENFISWGCVSKAVELNLPP